MIVKMKKRIMMMMAIMLMNDSVLCEFDIKISYYKSCLFTESPNAKLQHFSEVSL